MSPAGVPLPPSPGPETILAVMAKLPSAALHQPPSPVVSTKQPPSPATSTRQPLSPAVSTREPPSPVPSTRQPRSQPISPVPSTRKPPPLVTTLQLAPPSPRHPTSPAPRYPSPSSSAATRAHLPSPSGFHFPLPPQATPTVPGARTRDQVRGQDRSREREDATHPPARGGYLPESEDDDDEEEERRASEMKVSQWLTIPESPTTSSSLDHSLSLSHSNSLSSQSQSGAARAATGRRFGGAFGGIDEESGSGFGPEGMELWRGAVVADDDGEVLPEVERMALEAEERAHARGEAVADGATMESAKRVGRQRTLFGRRKEKGEEPAPVRSLTRRVCGRSLTLPLISSRTRARVHAAPLRSRT
ncbi:hypothetical protein JB92DRAFT_1591010 [Gautieria morchelliformis]|nr:hypothetical protein JB92DRAFT_1591010 [Gautieria morchelliformis]